MMGIDTVYVDENKALLNVKEMCAYLGNWTDKGQGIAGKSTE